MNAENRKRSTVKKGMHLTKDSMPFLIKLTLMTLLGNMLPQSLLAIGIGPPVAQLEGVLQGSTVETSIIISRAEPKEDEYAQIELDDQDAAVMVSVLDLTEDGLLLPKGVQQTKLTFIINAEGVEVGSYTVPFIVKRGAALETEGSGTQIREAVTGQLKWTVTQQERAALKVLYLGLDSFDLPSKTSPIIKVQSINEGNVPANYSFINISIQDRKTGQTIVENKKIAIDQLLTVEPFQSGSFQVDTEIPLQPGNYIMQATIADATGQEKEEAELFFGVLPSDQWIEQPWFWPSLAGSIFFMFCSIIGIYKYKKIRCNSNS